MMINLLKNKNGLILTKFLNKIWRRHAFFSNLGELFITKGDLKRLAPDYKFQEELILSRVVDEEDLESDDSNSNDNNESEESNESEEKKTSTTD